MRHLLVIFFALIVSVQALFAAEPERIMLTGDWEFRQAGSDVWYKADVPGCVHTDLLENGLIEDPFHGRNEKSLQWVGEKDWEYRKIFRIEDKRCLVSNAYMVLEGVDTYAEISINGLPVGNADNMFRTWRFNIKDMLKEGDNEILIRFESVFRRDMPKYLDAPYRLMAWPNNDQSDIWLSLYARKAGYHYGWDWGPRLITCGVWKPAYIEFWDDFKIEAVHVKTLALDSPSVKTGNARKATMQADIAVIADKPMEAVITVKEKGRLLCSQRCVLVDGKNEIACGFELKKPALWWCNGYGGQTVYEFTVGVQTESSSASYVQKAGVRTIDVIRQEDAWGKSMSLRLNGYDVFCKGSNWIPIDNFPGRRSRDEYASLVGDAAEVGMNMLRVWGGGLYEHEDFYDACDSLGIMVWQDMAFACGMFPSDERYLQSVTAEVRDNVRRLRNHPSLALWCGNNENEISYFEWGWNRTLTQDQREHYESGLRRLFYETVPEAIAEEDDTRYYHPTSPSTGHSGVPYSMGDAHMWSVWKGGWVEEYLKPHNIARFMSEYGFISYPDMFTLRKFVPEWDMQRDSPTMLAHHRAYDDVTRDPEFSNKMISRYLNRYVWVPERFEDFVYMTQWFQAETIKVAVEAHRRAKPYCMGTLFWQLNDCWPSISWSSIDYYGRWKALHYYVRRAYAPVLVSPYAAEDGMISIKAISDLPEKFEGVVEIYVLDFDGTVVRRDDVEFRTGSNECKDIFAMNPALLEGNRVLYLRLYSGNQYIGDNIYFSRFPNSYDYSDPAIRKEITATEDGYIVDVTADDLVRGLYLYTDNESDIFDDNYIDVIPGFTRRIHVRTDKPENEFKTTLKFHTL